MPRETMTPRERWQAVLEGQKPDRVPMDLWATRETFALLCKHLGCEGEEALRRLHVDSLLDLEPEYGGPPLEPHMDMWGVRYVPLDHGAGSYDECATHPLAAYERVEDIEAHYTWPSADWFDFSKLPGLVARNPGRAMRGGLSEPFLVYKNLRGDEQAFLDLLLDPELVHYCLGKMFDLSYTLAQRIFETVPGAAQLCFVAEDLGGQDGLLYSREHIREFLLPGMKCMMDLAHAHGARVFHHSDGAIRDILPDLVEAGIDLLNPIQWRCAGMDRAALKRDFGHRLVFHGGMDNQQTLPFGSVEDVRQEVRDNLRILGEGGGYILAPCHNIQAITPMENILALYETGYEEGWVS